MFLGAILEATMSEMREALRPALRRRLRIGGVALACLGAVALSGCGSTWSGMPLIGEPEQTPPAPKVTADFPNVAESGSTRTTKPLTPEERAKVEAELVTARTKAAQDMRQQINQGQAK
jgi:hypothetical protein